MTVSDASDPAVLAAVSDVLVRYGTGIDTRDWTLFRTCFTDDCEADYGEIPGRGTLRWQGGEAITAWMQASHAEMGHTMHRITNMRVESAGDERVTARSYVDVLLTTPGGELIVRGAGFYDDELILTDDGWRIARRRFTNVIMEPGPAPPPGA